MPEMKVDVEIWCSCGAGLCHQTSLHRTGRGFVVEPCSKCLDRAKDDGYGDGLEDGGRKQ